MVEKKKNPEEQELPCPKENLAVVKTVLGYHFGGLVNSPPILV